MKGLLRKDLYQMWYYARTILLTSAVMMVIGVMGGSGFLITYSGFMLGMMPMTLLAYDQTSRFAGYSAALPVTKAQLVGCKYLFGLGGMLLAEVLAAVMLGVAALLGKTMDGQQMVSTLLQVAAAALMNSAIMLPLTYRLGYEKAKYFFYLMVGLIAAWMGFGIASGEEGLAADFLSQDLSVPAMVGIAVVALALDAVSWRLSVAWYGKAEE